MVVGEYNFDACSVKLGFCECSETKTEVELIPKSEAGREGRRRSADDWSYTLDANDLALFAGRGFTGHEHLPWFNLYNMNGRMYDPLVARFLSPDNVIQNPTSTQNYNRYSYCLNNPLKYTDPSGNTYKQYMKATYGEGNYYYRGDAPGSWGPYNRNGGGGINGYSNDFGRTRSSGPPYFDRVPSRKVDAETTWIPICFFYYDENGKPMVNERGNSAEAWTFEVTNPNSSWSATKGITSNTDVTQGQRGQYPIDSPYISSDYGMRNGEMHNGIDFVNQQKGAVDGKPVYSVSDGKVVRLVTSPDGNRAGVRVRIQATNGYQYNYFHLQDGSNSHLKSDMTINKGDTIGKVGNTGVSRGAHLHFEIWAPNGTKVNPYDIYPALYNIPHR